MHQATSQEDAMVGRAQATAAIHSRQAGPGNGVGAPRAKLSAPSLASTGAAGQTHPPGRAEDVRRGLGRGGGATTSGTEHGGRTPRRTVDAWGVPKCRRHGPRPRHRRRAVVSPGPGGGRRRDEEARSLASSVSRRLRPRAPKKHGPEGQDVVGRGRAGVLGVVAWATRRVLGVAGTRRGRMPRTGRRRPKGEGGGAPPKERGFKGGRRGRGGRGPSRAAQACGWKERASEFPPRSSRRGARPRVECWCHAVPLHRGFRYRGVVVRPWHSRPVCKMRSS